jgi:hypothetical protein
MDNIEQIREEFEEWAKRRNWDLTHGPEWRPHYYYRNDATHVAWVVWQAAYEKYKENEK